MEYFHNFWNGGSLVIEEPENVKKKANFDLPQQEPDYLVQGHIHELFFSSFNLKNMQRTLIESEKLNSGVQ